MSPTLLLTIVGVDRPGLVERVSGAVAAHGGNWLESRLAHLGGHFAGVVRVEVPADRQDALRRALDALAADGLTVVATAAPSALAAPRHGVRLEVVGHDRPRIINEITAAVARHGLNVEELASEVTSAPMTGQPLFTARLSLGAAATPNLAALRADLEKIAADLMVDVSLDDGAA